MKNFKIKIQDIPEAERPREKLMALGSGALSDAELIAVVIGSGTSAAPVMEIALRLVAFAEKDLSALAELSLDQLCGFKGIGPARAVALQAAFELGRRSHPYVASSLVKSLVDNILEIIEGYHPSATPLPDGRLPTFVPLPVGSKKRRLFDIGERSIILLATGNFAKVRSYQHAESALAGDGPDRRIRHE